MGLFGKKKVDPRMAQLNEVLTESLVNSKTPEGIDQETYDLIGKILMQAFAFAEEMAKAFGRVNEFDIKRWVKKEYPWIDKANLDRIAARAIDRLG